MPGKDLATTQQESVDQGAVLAAMGLNTKHPATVAVVLICEKYGLAAELSHVQIVENKPYITHAGLLHIAHASKQLDGIHTEAKQGEDGWWAQCTVWRKDMSHPFVYQGYCGKAEKVPSAIGHRQRAIIRAERTALKRAFAIAVPDVEDDDIARDPVALSSNGDTPPALPQGQDVAIPTPDAAPPAESEVASLGTPPPIAPSPPPGVDPLTGEVEETVEQKQAKARAIAEQAEKNLDAKNEEDGKPKRTRRTKAQMEADRKAEEDRKAAQARAEAKLAEEAAAAAAPTEEQDVEDADIVEEDGKDPAASKRAQSLAIAASKAELDEETNDQLIDLVTDGRTTSRLEVTKDEAEDLELIFDAIANNRVEIRFDTDGFIVLHPGTPVNWRRLATEHEMTEAKVLRKAREMAAAWGVPVPSMTREIIDPELVNALLDWMGVED